MLMKKFLVGIGLVSILALGLVGCNSKNDTKPDSNPDPVCILTQQAEDYTEISTKNLNPGKDDISKKTIGEGENTVICAIKSGAWAKYETVDFGTGVKKFEIRWAAGKAGVELANRMIELHLDTPEGMKIGYLTVQHTGDPREPEEGWTAFEITSCDVSNVTGVHDLYLGFSAAAGVQSVMDLDWFKLYR